VNRETGVRDDLQLLIISSPSGAGKTTLTRRLLAAFPHFVFSVSHTTRPPRPSEIDGADYHFTTPEEFTRLRDAGAFAEWAEVHGNLYGTSVSEIERARELGKEGILFDIDYQGARQIKAKLPAATAVFILPPSLGELERRLRGRGSDDDATIARRLAKARAEIEHYGFFDYVVVNDDLDRATDDLHGIVRAERCRRHRLAMRAEELLR
jgi:guanylate kinase